MSWSGGGEVVASTGSTEPVGEAPLADPAVSSVLFPASGSGDRFRSQAGMIESNAMPPSSVADGSGRPTRETSRKESFPQAARPAILIAA